MAVASPHKLLETTSQRPALAESNECCPATVTCPDFQQSSYLPDYKAGY